MGQRLRAKEEKTKKKKTREPNDPPERFPVDNKKEFPSKKEEKNQRAGKKGQPKLNTQG